MAKRQHGFLQERKENRMIPDKKMIVKGLAKSAHWFIKQICKQIEWQANTIFDTHQDAVHCQNSLEATLRLLEDLVAKE